MEVKQGRKPKFKPELLEIGQAMSLGRQTIYGHQFAYQFNKRLPEMEFKFLDKQIVRVK